MPTVRAISLHITSFFISLSNEKNVLYLFNFGVATFFTYFVRIKVAPNIKVIIMLLMQFNITLTIFGLINVNYI